MKASDTLTKPFLVGVLSDICDLFPSCDFTDEREWLDSLFLNFEESEIIVQASRIGKAMEASLISGRELSCSEYVLFPSRPDSVFPSFLGRLWETVFLPSGKPIFSQSDYSDSLIDNLLGSFDDELAFARLCWGTQVYDEDRLRNQQALCVLLLRQFFLGMSKLSSLECLYLRNFGAGRIQG